MLVVLSPAKTLDYETPATTRKTTLPELLSRSNDLVASARELAPEDIRKLMGVSENLAELNHQRFMDWGEPFNRDNAKQSILAFKGDVYTGLEAETLDRAKRASVTPRQAAVAMARARVEEAMTYRRP